MRDLTPGHTTAAFMSTFEVRVRTSAISLQLSPFRFKAGDWEIGRALFAPLLRFASDFSLRPHLLADWAVANDGRVVRFRIRPDLVFHHGRPVEAADLAFSLERGRSADARACFRQLMADVVRIDILDSFTVEVALRRPNRMFPAYFTRAALGLVPREALHPDDPWRWREMPVGCGPYKVEGRDAGSLRLVRHAPFFGLTPHSPDRLVFVLEHAPEAWDLVLDEEILAEPDFTLVPSSFWSAVAVEHYSFVGQDEARAAAVRHLVNAAIAPRQLVAALPATSQAQYHPAAGFVPPAVGGQARSPVRRPAFSSALAAYERVWGALPRLINVIYRGYGPESDLRKLQKALGRQLRCQGLPVEDLASDTLALDPIEPAAAFVLAASSFNYPDHDNLSLYLARGGDIHRASTPGLERLRTLLDRGRETFDGRRQEAIYGEVKSLLEEGGWIHPVAHLPEFALVRTTKIAPCSLYANGPHPFFEDLRAAEN